ncbi:MAG TPA: hypothetical protein VKP69_31550, partial [Isosphaeraceae bacterium]|nr:hypothetical protein [Isosphaeraceae bacterium]
WLIADLVERATKKVRAPKDPGVGGNGKPVDFVAVAKYATAAMESEVSQVAAAPEGERNSTLWKASCALGSLAGAGVVDRAEAEEKLVEATTLPIEEAVDVVRRGLDRGAEAPRDLDHVGKNGDEVPTIKITTSEHEVNDQAVAALAADPDLYQRGHLLNRVLREPPRPDDMVLGRDPGGLTITPIHTSTLRERLTKYATWVKPKRGEDGESQLVPAHPPDWSVQAVANRGVWRGLRMLEGVTEVPLFRADGTILDTPGWDRKTGILYVPEIDYPAVPDRPTLEDARRAADALFEIVADFPFKDEDHRVVWLAALLTPIARPAIHGPCPMFVFDANIAGTGKSMLVDIISLITVGRCVGRTIYPASEEEMGKTMLAIAMGGSRLVLFDNAATGYPIGGPTLDAALTGGTWSGRVLQVSKFATDVPLCAVFFSSGNNLGLKGDTLRRIVLSQLESTDERPEERDNFKIPRLLDHVRARRGILAVHALTILEAYHVAGRPIPAPKPPPMGSFEGWNDLVRRAVHWVTGHDPCATKSEAKSIDKITATLPIVIDGWRRLCAGAGKGGLTATAGLQALEGNPPAFEDFLALMVESSKDGKLPNPHSLGTFLGKYRGRPLEARDAAGVVEHVWVLGQSEKRGTPRWVVRDAKTHEDPDDTPF